MDYFTTINGLGSGLRFNKIQNLEYVVHKNPDDRLQSSFTSQSAHRSEGLSVRVSSTKRKSSQQGGSSPKRTRSNSRQSNLGQQVQSCGLNRYQTSIMPPPTSPQHKRVFTCIAVTPARRRLEDFDDIHELLKAFRDTVVQHREQFTTRKLLQRDISIGNLLLTNPHQNDGYSGMLNDYDHAVQVGADGKDEASGAKTITRTLEFIAIEILESTIRKETAGIEHTYRHDLESFFYVFLALCMRYGRNKSMKPTGTTEVLRYWYNGSYEQISAIKRGQMEPGGFEIHILEHFLPTFDCVKGLARTLRTTLFGDGAVYTGTPTDPKTLYEPMVAAFEETIRTLNGNEGEIQPDPISNGYQDAEKLCGCNRKVTAE